MTHSLPSWRRITGMAMLSVIAVTVPGVVLTNASWTDHEHVVGISSTLDCATAADLASRATSRFLYGSLSGNSLDTVAGVTGVVVTNNGTTQSAVAGTPGASTSGPGYAAPLSASAINSAVQLGTSVSLPLTWPTGVYQQYGHAEDTGTSNSATGAVTNSGAIDTGAPGVAQSVGSLSLSTLPGIGSTLGNLADVALNVGAVASTASLDGCSLAWTGGTPTAAQLDRDYLVASLSATATSPTVAALFNTTGNITSLVNTDIATEFGTAGTSGEAETAITASGLGALTTGVSTALLSPLLNTLNTTLSLLGASLSVNGTSSAQQSSAVVSVNLAPVNTLLSSTITDGVVSVNLANGQIGVDIGALSGGLNNRPANTQLLTDAEVNDLISRVNTLLSNQITAIRTALTAALDSATVTVSLNVLVSALGSDVLRVAVGYSGTLKQFVDGTPTTPLVTVTGPTISVLGTGAVQSALNAAGITTLLGGILSTLGTLNTVTTTVLNTAQTQAYDELLGSQLDTTLASAAALETAAISQLSPLLTALGGLLEITLNAQPDQPDPVGTPSSSPQAGEYFVSALNIGAVNGATSLLDLWFATSSVGANAT